MILITGANGWLGLNLVNSICKGRTAKWGQGPDKIRAFILRGTDKHKLLEIAPDVEIVEGDLNDEKDVKQFLQNANDAYLFHTAGVIHPKRTSEFYKINRDATKTLIKASSRAKIKRAVVVSSNSPCGCNPSINHMFDESSEYNPYMNYGRSKMEMEMICNEFYQKGVLDLSIIRAPWFYGPFQPYRQKLFFEMIRKGKVPIVGSGKNRRSMVYTENLVQGLVLAAVLEKALGKTYWIADERSYSMNEIVDTIESVIERKLGQKCDHGRLRLPDWFSDLSEKADSLIQWFGFYHQKIHVLSEMNKTIACTVSKAQEELGYSPEYSLGKGIESSLAEVYN